MVFNYKIDKTLSSNKRGSIETAGKKLESLKREILIRNSQQQSGS